MEGLDKNFGDNDYGIATERQCMERAPSDNQERCAAVQLGHKQVLGQPLMTQKDDKNIDDNIDVNEVLVAGVHVLLQG